MVFTIQDRSSFVMLSVAKHLGQARQILRCAQDDRAALRMTGLHSA